MKLPKKKKSICIIGGGFYGCYIAKRIKENFKNINIEIYEKNTDLITEAGKNNQYRLHLGFHYPRSKRTRSLPGQWPSANQQDRSWDEVFNGGVMGLANVCGRFARRS